MQHAKYQKLPALPIHIISDSHRLQSSSRSLRHEREYSICHSRKYPMLILVCRGLSPHSHPPSHVPIYASLRGISSSSKMPFFTSVSGSGLDWSPFSKLSARM